MSRAGGKYSSTLQWEKRFMSLLSKGPVKVEDVIQYFYEQRVLEGKTKHKASAQCRCYTILKGMVEDGLIKWTNWHNVYKKPTVRIK